MNDHRAPPALILQDSGGGIGLEQEGEGNAPIAMMPKLQMSTLGPYSLRVTTSGAIQYGVPTIVVRFAFASEICAQKPKSAAETQARSATTARQNM